MTHIISKSIKQFKSLFSREDGIATIEFVVMVPAAMAVMFVAGESAVMNVRKSNLDRALEMTVRDLRLGQIENPTLSGLRGLICDRMGSPENCETDLTLELNVRNTNVANMTVPSLTATCVNRATRVEPVLTFNLGGANDLVLVRACYVVDIVFPTSAWSLTIADSVGAELKLVSTTAFVNEPR